MVAGAQPSERKPGSLPRLWDVAAAFLFEGSAGSKAEHIS